jgi:hypothetical protein
MHQAAFSDGLAFDPFSFEQDGRAPSEVDVCRGEIAEALMISALLVMFDEGGDLQFEVLREEVVLEQDAVLERLVPAFDLALRLRMAGSAVNLFDGTLFQPGTEVFGDVARAIVGKQARPVFDLQAVAA